MISFIGYSHRHSSSLFARDLLCVKTIVAGEFASPPTPDISALLKKVVFIFSHSTWTFCYIFKTPGFWPHLVWFMIRHGHVTTGGAWQWAGSFYFLYFYVVSLFAEKSFVIRGGDGLIQTFRISILALLLVLDRYYCSTVGSILQLYTQQLPTFVCSKNGHVNTTPSHLVLHTLLHMSSQRYACSEDDSCGHRPRRRDIEVF